MTREEAIKIIESNCSCTDSKLREACAMFIPELKESEDERIYNLICSSIKNEMPIGSPRNKELALAYLEKQKEQKPIGCSEDEKIRKAIINYLEYHCAGEKFYDTTWDDAIAWLKKPKEQKPAENISQLTVQGKGVYKICPRCKERMVRDDSKVYTSMLPQCGYTCPKCGTTEFDTVMYDSPKMEEQKPVEWSRQSIIDTLTKWLTEKIAPLHKKSLDGTITEKEEMFEAALLEMRSFVNSPDFQIGKDTSAEWSEEDEKIMNEIITIMDGGKVTSGTYLSEYAAWLKTLPERFNLQPKQEWGEEDCIKQRALIDTLQGETTCFTTKDFISWLKSLRPAKDCSDCAKNLEGYISGRIDAENKLLEQFGALITPEDELHIKPRWKPSEEQMEVLLSAEGLVRANNYPENAKILASLYEQLKKL